MTEKNRNKFNVQRLINKIFKSQAMVLSIFLIILSVGVSIAAPRFAKISNIAVITRAAAFVGLVSLGQMTCMIAGLIDISVGSTAGFAGIVGAMAIQNFGLNPYLSLLIAIITGTLIGVINGLLVAKVDLNPFITTLSTSFVLSGLILVVTSGYPVPIVSDIDWLGRGFWGPVPVPTIIIIVITILLHLFLNRTVMGRYIFAMGGNKDAAILVGIPTTTVTIVTYCISGGLAALAGVLLMARLASGQPTVGASWVMPSFAAPILGGASLSGGAGSAFGTFVGALMMAVISNSIVLTGMSIYWENVIVGVVLISAIIIDMLGRKKR